MSNHPSPEDFPLDPDAKVRSSNWFARAGLGLFVHWDHSKDWEISWPMVGGNRELPGAATQTLAEYYDGASDFDPRKWEPTSLARIARDAGVQYAVFTARHHSGWSAWPSKVASRSIASSPYGVAGGDLVREFVDAFRAQGIRVGLYYSLPDWGHPDYPAWSDELRPYAAHKNPPHDANAWQRYRQYLITQLEELLTGYGPIDLLWFDGEWERSDDEWGALEIAQVARRLSPGILINDRLYGQGDFRTPEQFIPPQALDVPWECCMTMNDSWAFVPNDTNYKSLHEILRTLVEVVSRGGNLLLNVGPTRDGEVPEPQIARLKGLAAWMAGNRESIVGANPGLESWQTDGPSSQAEDRVYLFQVARPVETIVVRGISINRVRRVTVVATSEELTFRVRRSIHEGRKSDPLGELLIDVPSGGFDGPIPVVAVEITRVEEESLGV